MGVVELLYQAPISRCASSTLPHSSVQISVLSFLPPSARGAHMLTRGEERKERAATDGKEMTRAMDEAATGADETAAATVDEVVTVTTSTSTRTASSIDARKRRRQSSSSVMRGFGR
jgi:translation initiation factor 2B subunit (eIF-2B alpha/beta/delta family)